MPRFFGKDSVSCWSSPLKSSSKFFNEFDHSVFLHFLTHRSLGLDHLLTTPTRATMWSHFQPCWYFLMTSDRAMLWSPGLGSSALENPKVKLTLLRWKQLMLSWCLFIVSQCIFLFKLKLLYLKLSVFFAQQWRCGGSVGSLYCFHLLILQLIVCPLLRFSSILAPGLFFVFVTSTCWCIKQPTSQCWVSSTQNFHRDIQRRCRSPIMQAAATQEQLRQFCGLAMLTEPMHVCLGCPWYCCKLWLVTVEKTPTVMAQTKAENCEGDREMGAWGSESSRCWHVGICLVNWMLSAINECHRWCLIGSVSLLRHGNFVVKEGDSHSLTAGPAKHVGTPFLQDGTLLPMDGPQLVSVCFRFASGLPRLVSCDCRQKIDMGKLWSSFCLAGVVFGASGTVQGLLFGMAALRGGDVREVKTRNYLCVWQASCFEHICGVKLQKVVFFLSGDFIVVFCFVVILLRWSAMVIVLCWSLVLALWQWLRCAGDCLSWLCCGGDFALAILPCCILWARMSCLYCRPLQVILFCLHIICA